MAGTQEPSIGEVVEQDRKRIAWLRQWAEQAMRAGPLSGEMIVGIAARDLGTIVALLADFDTRLRALEAHDNS